MKMTISFQIAEKDGKWVGTLSADKRDIETYVFGSKAEADRRIKGALHKAVDLMTEGVVTGIIAGPAIGARKRRA